MLHLCFPCGLAGKESACNVGDLGSIFRLGRSPGEGKGHPLQHSGLENPMDCTVMGLQRVGDHWATFTHTYMCILIHVSSKWDHDNWNMIQMLMLNLTFWNLILFRYFIVKQRILKHSLRTSIISSYYNLLNDGHFRVFLILNIIQMSTMSILVAMFWYPMESASKFLWMKWSCW